MFLWSIFVILSFFVAVSNSYSCVEIEKKSCLCSYDVHNEETGRLEMHASCIFMDLYNLSAGEESSENAKYITSLDLSFNHIKSLEFKQSASRLRILRIAYNEIVDLYPEAFHAIPNLEILDLSSNLILKLERHVFQALKKLRVLNLSKNGVEDISDELFKWSDKLVELDLSYNKLGAFISSRTNLTILPANISSISLGGNRIESIPHQLFDSLSQLKYLNLADNTLTTIPTVPFTIRSLDLSGNLFTALVAKYLNYHSLKNLKLNRLQRLTQIESYAFYNLFELENLELSNCPKLKSLHHLAFGKLDGTETLKLRKLTIDGNNLSTLNSSFLELFKGLDEVALHNNPWLCDCDIIWLIMQYDKIASRNYLRCAAPKIIRNKLIKDLVVTDFTYCMNTRAKRLHRILIPTIAVLIILLVPLIAYLVFKSPLGYAINSRALGPFSPYEGINQHRPL